MDEKVKELAYWERCIKDAADYAGVDVGGTVGKAALQMIAEEVERLKAAMTEIAKGDGAFNRDRLTHADNCIENMKSIADAALAGTEGGAS